MSDASLTMLNEFDMAKHKSWLVEEDGDNADGDTCMPCADDDGDDDDDDDEEEMHGQESAVLNRSPFSQLQNCVGVTLTME